VGTGHFSFEEVDLECPTKWLCGCIAVVVKLEKNQVQEKKVANHLLVASIASIISLFLSDTILLYPFVISSSVVLLRSKL
jgi:cytochrome bd-type quinol oxidase subunit 2